MTRATTYLPRRRHQIETTIVAGLIAALCGHRRHLPRTPCVQGDQMIYIEWYAWSEDSVAATVEG